MSTHKKTVVKKRVGIATTPKKDKKTINDLFSSLWVTGDREQIDFLVENFPQYLNMDRKDLLLEIVGIIRMYGFDAAYQVLNNAKKEKNIFWDQPFFEEAKNSVNREISIFTYENVDEDEQNIGTCGKCGSTRLLLKRLQVRSGDEPMTSFFACKNCGFRWQQ